MGENGSLLETVRVSYNLSAFSEKWDPVHEIFLDTSSTCKGVALLKSYNLVAVSDPVHQDLSLHLVNLQGKCFKCV